MRVKSPLSVFLPPVVLLSGLLASADAAKASTTAKGSSAASHSDALSTSVSSFVAVPTPASSSALNPASLVNLFIGTTNGGHVFPGEILPANKYVLFKF